MATGADRDPTKAKSNALVRAQGERGLRAAEKAWNALHEVAAQFPKIGVPEYRPFGPEEGPTYMSGVEIRTLNGDKKIVDIASGLENLRQWQSRNDRHAAAEAKRRAKEEQEAADRAK